MKRWETPWGYDRNQAEFDRQGSWVIILIAWLVRLLAYLPMLLISYAIAKHFMKASATQKEWSLFIGITTLLQLSLIKAAKWGMQELKSRGNLWWFAIWLLLLAYCCVLPMVIMYEPCRQLVAGIFHKNTTEIVYIILFAYGLFCCRMYFH